MRIAFVILVLALIGIQFIRPARNEARDEQKNDLFTSQSAPEEIRSTIEHSCYDCHSNQTHYPWYSSIQPAGWWLQHHVNEGKSALNFSEFKLYSARRAARKLDECYQELADDTMPLRSYTWLHRSARLSAEQKRKVMDWLDTTEARLQPDKDESEQSP